MASDGLFIQGAILAPSLCLVRGGVFSPTLPIDMTKIVLIRLGQFSVGFNLNSNNGLVLYSESKFKE